MSKSLHNNIEIENILASATLLKIKEVEEIIKELNTIVTKNKLGENEYQDRALLSKINQTVLSKDKKERYFEFLQKLEQETISEEERQAFLKLTEEEETLRNERVAFMLELARLREVPLTQIMQDLGLNPIPNA